MLTLPDGDTPDTQKHVYVPRTDTGSMLGACRHADLHTSCYTLHWDPAEPGHEVSQLPQGFRCSRDRQLVGAVRPWPTHHMETGKVTAEPWWEQPSRV